MLPAYTATIATVTLVVACFGALVGFVQWRTANLKVMLDVFDRRWKVYEATRQFLRSVNHTGQASVEAIEKFRDATAPAVFLFGPEMPAYFKSIADRAFDHRTKRLEWQDVPAGDERTRLVNEEGAIVSSITDELATVDAKFAKYMNISVADEGAWKSFKRMVS